MDGRPNWTQGHLTIRDPAGRGFWMKRTGIAFPEVKGRNDFVLVDLTGNRLAGNGGVHGEWPIHAKISGAAPTSMRSATPIRSTLPSFRPAANRCGRCASRRELSPAPSRDIPTPPISSTRPARPRRGQGARRGPGRPYEKPRCRILRPLSRGMRACRHFSERACHAQLVVGASGFSWEYPNEREMREKYLTVMTPKFIQNSWEFYRPQTGAPRVRRCLLSEDIKTESAPGDDDSDACRST